VVGIEAGGKIEGQEMAMTDAEIAALFDERVARGKKNDDVVMPTFLEINFAWRKFEEVVGRPPATLDELGSWLIPHENDADARAAGYPDMLNMQCEVARSEEIKAARKAIAVVK
jgi:hypothetical protein